MWIDVKADFGAVGDGTNDDTTAIQNAIDAAQAVADPDERNVIYFPPGTYRITSELVVTENQGLRLVGSGNVQGLPVYLGDYQFRETGAILYWDGDPSGTLMRIKNSYYGSLENLTFVGATPQKYKFDASSTSAGPAAEFIRFNNGSFASVTEIYANVENFYGVDITDWLTGLDAGGRLTIQQRNSANFAIFDVISSTAGGPPGNWIIGVNPVQSSGTGVFANNAEVFLSFVRTIGTPQPYAFSDSTSSNPANGTLRFNNSTFTSINAIYADDLSDTGWSIGAWLDSIDDDDDVRVTVQLATSSSAQRIFKVTSVANSSGYRTITVTPIVSVGTINNNDPVVLICSTATPIRDRAGALVVQQGQIDPDYPAGHMFITNCTFREADDGVRLDEASPTRNCDLNSFVHCSFLDCAAGVKCNSSQVLNNLFYNCDFNGCKIGIDHAKGGDVRVYGASMSGNVGGVFMRIAEGGTNASSFILNGVRLEISGGKPSLLETNNDSQYHFINASIDGFGWSGFYPAEWAIGTNYVVGNEVFAENTDTVYRSLTGTDMSPNVGNEPTTSPTNWQWLGDWVRPVRIGQGTNCTMRDSVVKGPFAHVTGNTGYATLKMDHCRFEYTDSDVITTGTNGIFKLVDCTDGLGEPINDTGNWPTDPTSQPPIGSISAYGGTTAPVGWLMCDGSAVSRTTYADLFDVIGETYGAGNTTTTFNLPDLQQRFPLGKASSGTGDSLGDFGGDIDHTHTVNPYDADVPIPVSGKVLTTVGTHEHTTEGANPPYLVVNYIIKT